MNTNIKENSELQYWQKVIENEGKFKNSWYSRFYTKHFQLEPSFYSGKKILDIGCGPRGSLEWADMAIERVGLDPLANKYLDLAKNSYKMSFVNAPSESIPFDENYFDVVTSFNSIDHVDDLNMTIFEIKRVLKLGGIFLLLSDVNHDPTPCEPMSFSWDIVQTFLPEFKIIEERHYEKVGKGLYDSIDKSILYNHSDFDKRYGIISVKFEKVCV